MSQHLMANVNPDKLVEQSSGEKGVFAAIFLAVDRRLKLLEWIKPLACKRTHTFNIRSRKEQTRKYRKKGEK